MSQTALRTQQSDLQAMSAAMLQDYRERTRKELDDPRRVAAVYGSAFASGSGKEQAETVTVMAAQLLRVPHAQVNLLTDAEQVVAAAFNDPPAVVDPTPERHTRPVTEGFCQFVIPTGETLAVAEAEKHPLVCDTKASVNGEVVSYLGVPVEGRDGLIIGTLCVWDVKPRNWIAADVELLARLARVLTRVSAPVTEEAQ